MNTLVRNCSKVARWVTLVGQTTSTSVHTLRPSLTTRLTLIGRSYASHPRPKKTAEGKVNCACARHPWPMEKEEVVIKKTKDCEFDFRKIEVNPYDIPCDCKDPPPAAGCADVGKPKEVCCRTTRQYGCYCEEEEESCEEEEEAEVEVGHVTCDLDFRKLEVNPYDDPCECIDPPPVASCEDLLKDRNICCRTPKPFGCMCEAYDEPGLICIKPKTGPKTKQPKKECVKKNKFDVKCL